MASYLCVKMNSSATKSYNIKSSANKPYLRVDTGFIPLTTATATGPKLMVRAGGVNYRLADFITTTTAITTGTSYLTSAKTTSTSYVTGSRASTSGTGYATRASTSSTGYQTRWSTYATGYETRASTSATGYQTRASTSATGYKTRASTSATSYITKYASTFQEQFYSATSRMTGFISNSSIIPNALIQNTSKLISINPYTLSTTDYSYPQGIITITNTCGLVFTFKDTAIYGVGLRGSYISNGSLKPYADVSFRLNSSKYKYGTFFVSTNGNGYRERPAYFLIDSITSSVPYIRALKSTSFAMPENGYAASNTVEFLLTYPDVNHLYYLTFSTSSSHTANKTSTVIRQYEMDLQYGALTGFNLISSMNRYFTSILSSFTSCSIGTPKWSASYYTKSITSTSYLTRSSTSTTTYGTRASTYNTTYGTRTSASKTTYVARASTSNTTYATRSSTSNTTYATRSSQYTSNTSYLTQSETYQTSYITASTETTMEG